MATTEPTWQEQGRALRNAAEVLEGCAAAGIDVHDAQGRTLGILTPLLTAVLAKRLRLSATAIETTRRAVGQLIHTDLELAGLVMGTDLGHHR